MQKCKLPLLTSIRTANACSFLSNAKEKEKKSTFSTTSIFDDTVTKELAKVFTLLRF